MAGAGTDGVGDDGLGSADMVAFSFARPTWADGVSAFGMRPD
jgi:hypothetical protein